MDENKPKKLDIEAKIAVLGLEKTTRHIFLCGGSKCCSGETGDEIWAYLKAQIAALNNDNPNITVQRTRATCLRICQQGPIAVVYPEGAWYKLVNKDMCDRIISKHLLHGKIVDEALILTQPLSP